jgi:hypothetical protein
VKRRFCFGLNRGTAPRRPTLLLWSTMPDPALGEDASGSSQLLTAGEFFGTGPQLPTVDEAFGPLPPANRPYRLVTQYCGPGARRNACFTTNYGTLW